MKRFVLFLAFILLSLNCCIPAFANDIADKKNESIITQFLKNDKKAVKQVILKQSKYASKYDYAGLLNLYSSDFKSADGFDKQTYFKLIEDTWKAYPDITYKTNIKNIRIKNDTAEVDVYETSLATSTQIEGDVTLFGELNSYSNSTYYLRKTNNKWLFTGEKVFDEKSFLKYGDTRFVKMDLTSPVKIKSGEIYTSSLSIDMPANSGAIASIGRDIITYPQEKSDEVFRKIPSDNILERMFTSNKQGKNEYNVASVWMAKVNPFKSGGMAGVAFIITRVNVEDENAEENQ